MTRIFFITLLFLSAVAGRTYAADQPPQRGLVLDAERRAIIIDSIIRQLNDSYQSAEIATLMGQALRQHLERDAYQGLADPVAFAAALTAHLGEVSGDAHLKVTFSPRPAAAASIATPTIEERAQARVREREAGASHFFGFRRVERLDWNVGYIDLRGFFPAVLAGEKAAAAMSLVADTAALVIDLRNNTGGEADMVAWLMSYFFEEPVLTSTVYLRGEDRLRQFWTAPVVPGRRYVDGNLYILTSHRTISAAEAFAYSMQAHGRARVVGEVTAGAANPGGIQRIDDDFAIWMPRASVTHPVTKTNWEGVGVQPDIPIASDLALHAAHIAALQELAGKSRDAERVEGLNRTIARLQKEMDARQQ